MLNSPIEGLPYKRLTPESATWPRALNSIPDPPRELWAIGNTSLLNTWCVAIVGARHCSQVGLDTTWRIADVLASEVYEQYYTIVSGLADGIDGQAHRATLNCGGATIAVLVDIGLDHITPYKNRQLARDIINNNGLLISENRPGFSLEHSSAGKGWWGEQFKRRDRITTGLSFLTIPVQAALHSGTTATIAHARRQNRLVQAPSSRYSQEALEDVQLHPECYAGIHEVVGKNEYFRHLDMTYQNLEGEWCSFLEFLRDYRLSPGNIEW